MSFCITIEFQSQALKAYIYLKQYSYPCQFNRAGNTGGALGGHAPPPRFCVAKRKKGNKGKHERVSKQKLLKGCHQGQNVTVLAITWQTLLFSLPWPLHFEIHFAGPFSDMIPRFGHSVQDLGIISDWVLHYIFDRHNW